MKQAQGLFYKTLQICNLPIPYKASVFVQNKVLMTNNRKENDICPFFVNYKFIKVYKTGAGLRIHLQIIFSVKD